MSNQFSNRLLNALLPSDASVLASRFTEVEMPENMSLEVPQSSVKHVYFPKSGIASAVMDADKSAHSHPIEIGLIGREGMTGISIILGDYTSSHSVYMQAAGEGYRLDAEALRDAIDNSRTLHALLLKYVKVFIAQISQTALANARSKIEQRLARWLLMADDRLDGPTLYLRHEFLSIMLGVRRAGVTDAMNALEGRGLIKASRGKIRIVDRNDLAAEANGCYGAAEAEYRRLIGS
jgi:CRP-like cAMP-binding protein